MMGSRGSRSRSATAPSLPMGAPVQTTRSERRIPLSSIHIDGESNYEASNGHRPGAGGSFRGPSTWVFDFGGGHIVQYNFMKWSEAKKAAKKEAQRLGVFGARVMP